jgi:hypothetical protein
VGSVRRYHQRRHHQLIAEFLYLSPQAGRGDYKEAPCDKGRRGLFIEGHGPPPGYAPIDQLQMMRFKGGKWELFGDIISAEQGS